METKIMRGRKKVVYGVPVLAIILTVLWNERWSFRYLSNQWPVHGENGECERVLLVADPQLIGYRRESYGEIARWDSDRYLSTGFEYASWFFRPTSVIFMGDLFDEGLDADEEEWTKTYERFLKIFPIESNQNVIYIAGDNDIGGESELISIDAKNRFYHFFRNNVTNLEPYYSIYETFLFDQNANLKNLTNSKISLAKILTTHVPYLGSSYKYTNMGEGMDLILSAHDHTTGIYEIQRSPPKAVRFSRVSDASPTYIKIIGPNEPLVELQTPTCSYRMGVASMGYGALSICRLSDGYRSIQVQYSVFWLPSRFSQLFLYLIVVIFSFSWVICQKRSRAKRYSWLQ